MKSIENIDVIVVDDSKDVCELITSTIKRFYTFGSVIGFCDVFKAIKYCLGRESGIAIFITDLFLGGASGFFFIDSIEEKFPNARSDAIFVTGNCSYDILELCDTSGINYILEKPIKNTLLKLAVRAIATKYLNFNNKLFRNPAFKMSNFQPPFSTPNTGLFQEGLDVIIVDLNTDSCDQFAKAIKSFYKYGSIICFNDVYKAIKYCLSRESGVAIFLAEVFLGDVSGFFFIDSIEKKFPNAYSDAIIVMGNGWGDTVAHMCDASDINYLLKKPIKRHLLKFAVRAIATKYFKFSGQYIDNYESNKQIHNIDICESTTQINGPQENKQAKGNYINQSEKKLRVLLKKIYKLLEIIDKLFSLTKNIGIQSKLANTKFSISYCLILTNLLKNMFFVPELNPSYFDLNKTIRDIFNILSDTACYQFKQYQKTDCWIDSDESMLSQIIFVFFKHINDYCYGKNGYLEVKTGTSKNSNNSSNNKIDYVELHYEIADKRTNSKDKDFILVVDDEEYIIDILIRSFSGEGFKVHGVSSGFDCLDFINENIVDLIVLDIGMIGMEGTEVLETMRRMRNCKNVPVLIYSGFISEHNIKELKIKYGKFNPIQVLPKPSSTQKIVTICKELLNREPIECGLKDFLNYNIVDSIKNDTILRMGFYSVMKISKVLGIDIEINDSSSSKFIRIKINSLPSNQLKNKKSLPIRYINEAINQDVIELLNSNFRHDIKNKLYIVYGDIQDIKKENINSQQADLIHNFFLTFDECEAVLDSLFQVT